jgi:hypothetical protein
VPRRPSARTRISTFLRWQPDKWERLHVLAQLVGSARSVLDVGGRGGELAMLLPLSEVMSTNLREPADIVYEGDQLPFADRSFEAVTSSDVIEHLPAEQRQAHVDELVRVARYRVIIGCPLGTAEHAASEQRIAQDLRDRYGLRLDFLEEHLEYGLPTEEELRALVGSAAPEATVRLHYHADFRAGEAMLLEGVAARWGHDPKAVVRLLRDSYFTRRSLELSDRSTPTTNRIYAVVELPA